MKNFNYYKNYSNNFGSDFTANDMAPAYISNPEHKKYIPHRRH